MRIVLLVLEVPLLLMVLYLDLLSAAALLWRRAPISVPPRYRFALLVPAHNEEQQLPRLLRSIRAMDYPRHLYDVHVVADNCTDRTASVAEAEGAIVHERRSESFRAKGYALQLVLEHIRMAKEHYDGYVIVDADSVVSANLLSVMNSHLARGDQAVQCYYGVFNRHDSWVSALSYAALALFNNLRPRGRDALGLSAGLRGNGMCFVAAVIDRFGWDTFGLTEDQQYHARLIGAGIRVRYAPEAHVLAEQPTSLRQAYSQGIRWERGRFQLSPWRLLSQGLRRRDAAPLDALAEQLVPSLSVLTGAIGLAFVLTAVMHLVGPWLLAGLLLLGELFYVGTGLRLVHAGWRTYRGLLTVPLYVAWKLWVVAVAVSHARDNRWIRTARPGKEA